MATALSKAQQGTTVGEGLALGCVALGVDLVEGSKVDLEFAFRRAWRGWPYRFNFPAVRADVGRDDLLSLLDKSEGRRSAHLTGWSSQWPFQPYKLGNWTVEDVADLLPGGVPLAGWKHLASTFLAELVGSSPASTDA